MGAFLLSEDHNAPRARRLSLAAELRTASLRCPYPNGRREPADFHRRDSESRARTARSVFTTMTWSINLRTSRRASGSAREEG